MTIEIDVDKLLQEVEEKAIEDFKKALTEDCTGAIRNARSQLYFKDNFKYAWCNCKSPETRDSIAEIIYGWVKKEFRDEVIAYMRSHKDFKEICNSFVSNDDFATLTAEKIANSRKFTEKIIRKIKSGD